MSSSQAKEWSFPSELHALHKQFRQSSAVFPRLLLLPALQAELNQNGFQTPKALAELLVQSLHVQADELRLSLPAREGESRVESWQFDPKEGRQRQSFELDAERYKTCQQELHINDLYEPEWSKVQELIKLFFGEPQKSLLNLPLFNQGQLIAVLHLAHPEPKHYDRIDRMSAQMVGGVLAPALSLLRAQNQVQFRQTQIDHLHNHYNTLEETNEMLIKQLEQGKRAFDKMKENYHKVKVRAWENQEKYALLQEELDKGKPEDEKEHNPVFPQQADTPAPVQPKPQQATQHKKATSPQPLVPSEKAADAVLSSLTTEAQHDLPTPSMASLVAGNLLREIATPGSPPARASESSTILDAFPTFQDELESFWSGAFQDDDLELPAVSTPTSPTTPQTAKAQTPTQGSDGKQGPASQTSQEEIQLSLSDDNILSYESSDGLDSLEFDESGLPTLGSQELDQPIQERVGPTAAPPPVPTTPMTNDPPVERTEELLLADFQIEETIQAKSQEQVLLYLSEDPLLPTLGFLEAAQEKQFRLHSTQSPREFVRTAIKNPPTALAILKVRIPGMRRELLQGLTTHDRTKHQPIFDINLEQEVPQIRLNWREYQTLPQPEYRWRDWFQKLYPNSQTEEVSIVCVDLPQTHEPLLHFFCGPHFDLRQHDNPVDGIEAVYQMPPDLFAVRIDSIDVWEDLFVEFQSSVRTKDIPLMLLCKKQPGAEQTKALNKQGANHIILFEEHTKRH